MTAYATLEYADTYFSNKLYSNKWGNTSQGDREAALEMGADDMDRLNFVGMKHAAWVAFQTTHDKDELLAAGATQARQFPRGSDTETPDAVKRANCEIAFSRIDGIDPDQEYIALTTVSEGYSSVRQTYNRSIVLDHILHGIASATAWRYLLPYLRRDRGVKLRRV